MSLELGLGSWRKLLAQEAQAAQSSGGSASGSSWSSSSTQAAVCGHWRRTRSAWPSMRSTRKSSGRPEAGQAWLGTRGGPEEGGVGTEDASDCSGLWQGYLWKRAPAEELGRTLVPAAAQLPLLFAVEGARRKSVIPLGCAVLRGGEGGR